MSKEVQIQTSRGNLLVLSYSEDTKLVIVELIHGNNKQEGVMLFRKEIAEETLLGIKRRESV